MRRLGATLTLVVVACGSTATPTTTTDPRSFAAREFAVSAGRALEGTRYASLTSEGLATLVVELCAGTGSLLADVGALVTSASASATPGDPGDDVILTEVLTVGAADVCPERAAGDLAAAFLAAVRLAAGTAPVNDAEAMNAGLSSCATLDQGTPADAVEVVAAGLFGVEATEEELLAGAITIEGAATVGAVIAAAVTFLCPEHVERVEQYLADMQGVDGR